MLKVIVSRNPGRGFSAVDALGNEGGYNRSSARLSQWVALLAMRYGRAPLPVSHGLQKALQTTLTRQDLVDDPAELGDLARRYLFLGDEKMLPAESRKRPTPFLHSLEFVKQFSAKIQTQSETGVQYQCP